MRSAGSAPSSRPANGEGVRPLGNFSSSTHLSHPIRPRRSARAKGRRGLRAAALALLAAAVLVGGLPASAAAEDWRTIVPGVTFRTFELSGPVVVHVARMDVATSDVILESSIASGSLAVGRETVSSMANRYQDTLSAWGGAWGPREQVVVAVNGSSYTPETGEPYGGLLHGGWYARRFGDNAGTSGMAWTADRRAVIGGCVDNPEDRNLVGHRATGATMEIQSVNSPREKNGLILFTPQYDGWTPVNDGDIEVVIEVTQPVGSVAPPLSSVGVVREQRQGQGQTPILFDQVILAAHGSEAEAFALGLQVGDEIEISQEITDHGHGCRGGARLNWSNVYASIGGGYSFLRKGKVHSNDDVGSAIRDPRTAFCVNDDQVDFVVVDGRQDGYSIGMTLDELGDFCRDKLGDTWGINQDGGGSSAMWVDGEIVNRPSDGQERAVANGMMMVVVEPPVRSSRFAPGFRVLVQQSGDVRLGPGDNYAVLDSLRPGTLAEILPTQPSIRGVFATGMFWWKVLYDGEEGWVPEASLVSYYRALAVFQIPSLPFGLP
jgi:Phosphodiester glycosidase/Bacterial SH3 domain